jgi:glutamate/tyrosine decarboxylase-like PLP-dependent enzyme
VAFVRNAKDLEGAMSVQGAAYLPTADQREPARYTPEFSRRARGIEIWAALSSLGRSGLADLIGRCCRYAERFAAGLSEAGYEVLNEVALNQAMVHFRDDATTKRVIAAVQDEGTCWCGGTVWHGKAAMRISVSSWATTEDDVERSLEAIVRVAQYEG